MLMLLEFLKDIIFFGGYINGSKEAFLQPLSPADERECLERMASGDEKAREMLIEHNLRLVAHIAKKYAKNPGDTDDFISIGTIGLIKGVNTFNTNKGKLATYISKCVENEILMYLRSIKKSSSDVSLSEPLGEDGDGNQIAFFDILTSDDSGIDEHVALKLQTEKLRDIFEKVLSPRERLIIELRYGLNGEILPQREIAQRLDISRSYVSRIEKNALLKLRKKL